MAKNQWVNGVSTLLIGVISYNLTYKIVRFSGEIGVLTPIINGLSINMYVWLYPYWYELWAPTYNWGGMNLHPIGVVNLPHFQDTIHGSTVKKNPAMNKTLVV